MSRRQYHSCALVARSWPWAPAPRRGDEARRRQKARSRAFLLGCGSRAFLLGCGTLSVRAAVASWEARCLRWPSASEERALGVSSSGGWARCEGERTRAPRLLNVPFGDTCSLADVVLHRAITRRSARPLAELLHEGQDECPEDARLIRRAQLEEGIPVVPAAARARLSEPRGHVGHIRKSVGLGGGEQRTCIHTKRTSPRSRTTAGRRGRGSRGRGF